MSCFKPTLKHWLFRQKLNSVNFGPPPENRFVEITPNNEKSAKRRTGQKKHYYLQTAGDGISRLNEY